MVGPRSTGDAWRTAPRRTGHRLLGPSPRAGHTDRGAVGAVTAATVLTFASVGLAGCSGTGPQPQLEQPTRPAEVAALAAKVPSAIARDGALTIGTDPSYPPMEFLSEDSGSLQGADVDLAGAVASVLGLEPRFENEAFSALTDSVRTGRIELAVSSLTVPPDLPSAADAVLYFRSGNQLVTSQSGSGVTTATLCGTTVATVEGSTQVRNLARIGATCRAGGAPSITIEALSDQEQVTAATLTSRVDAMLTDTPVAQYAVAQNPGRLSLAGPAFDEAPFGMLSPPQYRRFTKAVRGAVDHLIREGFYQSTLRRWGIADGAVAHASIRWNSRSEAARDRAAARKANKSNGSAVGRRG